MTVPVFCRQFLERDLSPGSSTLRFRYSSLTRSTWNPSLSKASRSLVILLLSIYPPCPASCGASVQYWILAAQALLTRAVRISASVSGWCTVRRCQRSLQNSGLPAFVFFLEPAGFSADNVG